MGHFYNGSEDANCCAIYQIHCLIALLGTIVQLRNLRVIVTIFQLRLFIGFPFDK